VDGTYALSGLVLLLGGYWLFAWRSFHEQSWLPALAYGALPGALMVLPSTATAGRASSAYTLVQPNIGQDQINDPRLSESQFQTIAGLSLARKPGTIRIALWPEGGLPDYLRPGYPPHWYAATTYGADPALARSRIGRVIGPGSLLLTGATDLDMRGKEVAAARNVVTALGPDGAISRQLCQGASRS